MLISENLVISFFIGCGIGSDVRTEVNYIPEKVSHLITSMLSLGAVEIDGDAARVQLCAE